MTTRHGAAQPPETLLFVYKHSTPLAVILVAAGAFLSPLTSLQRLACLGLLAFGLAFNALVLRSVRRTGSAPAGLVQARMAVNFCVNCVLVYALGWHWEPIWLLLLLTPLAAALYYERRQTAFTAVGTTAELLAIDLARWTQGPVAWGGQLAYAAAIVLLPLMVQEAARASRR